MVMPNLEIVAHRGVPQEKPENTIPSFQRAIELGADAIELDIRLTRDRVPIVYHYFYLDEATSSSGLIFNYTLAQLQDVKVLGSDRKPFKDSRIPTLHDILDILGGQIGLEIEIKGPEPESSRAVGDVLNRFKHLWETIEVTSYEPILLLDIQQRCPKMATDLLFPRSENWMKLDVIAYLAIHRAKLARARAIHLHPTQLSSKVVSAIRSHGIEVHAWDVNDVQSLRTAVKLGIPKICTDNLQQALNFRERELIPKERSKTSI